MNPLRGRERVFVKEDLSDNSMIVSWEHARGKTDDGDVNVQAQLFANGDIRVCFGCGSLPAGLSMTMVFDSDYEHPAPPGVDGPTPGVSFGPADNDIWPTNQCFSYTVSI